MNIFTKALLGSVITLGSLFTTTAEAQAKTCFYVEGTSAAICNTYEGRTRDGYALFRLGFAHGNSTSTMDVVCNGPYMVRWQSRSQNMSHSYNQTLANYFCSL